MSLDFLKNYEEIINKAIKKNIDEIKDKDESETTILEGMEYALLAGGKRIRPSFCLIGALIGGLSIDDVIDFATGIEFIHTYSLVHDDLPGMDDDDLRRGKPTCHIKYGVGEGILIGDALLTHGISLLLKNMDNVGTQVHFEAISIMLDAIGLYGMIGGQAADLKQEKTGEFNEEKLEYIHRNKTGKLLEASLISGAKLAGAEVGILDDLKNYSSSFGLAFQITDDILDITSSEEELGKPIGSDMKNDKLTYPKIYGLKKAKEKALEEVENCRHIAGKYDEYGKQLIELAEYLLERRK